MLKNTPTTKLMLADVQRIVQDIVFRDAQIAAYPTNTINEAAYVVINIPIVPREHDRKLPYQKYSSVKEFNRMHTEYTYENTYENYLQRTPDNYLRGSCSILEDCRIENVPKVIISTIVNMLNHEVQENFYYKGERIFDPHITKEFYNVDVNKKINEMIKAGL